MNKFACGLCAATLALAALSPFSASAQTLQSVPASPFTGPLQNRPGPFFTGQGYYRPFDTSDDLAFEGGPALPAVTKDTIPGFTPIHSPELLNDGNYGNGASWISNSRFSWIKIDLGQSALVSSVLFGRDRLGVFDDRDPGQFTIALSLTDNVYTNGNDSNDAAEYIQVFDSAALGYSGFINGTETLQATLSTPTLARFVKLTFANSGTAIDEVQVRGRTVTAVPEPGMIALLGAFCATGILAIRRRS